MPRDNAILPPHHGAKLPIFQWYTETNFPQDEKKVEGEIPKKLNTEESQK